ncbi:MAG: DUF445 domain-containing protein [Selenomonas sp.]|uniref:DUF445 domain-containing protein n=1 Tax=Selenomonas sp. TaxID=2053611 RepID=UPI0025D8AF6C|nr:DUF445 domain-containing protein [Selenomonas sp.]MCR5757601.1 DUF445 domain-containing protein [Selenomonas sp.]
MQKKNKADLALGISAAGFFCTFALPESFAFSMVHHGFLAATIGGLADWFAVTAIFRKPLGISYRTDILRRNRSRIMDALVTYASEDLLSTENIMSVMEKQDMAQLMSAYFIHRGGRERVRQVVDAVLLRIANDLDTQRIAVELTPPIQQGLSSLAFEDILPEVLRLLTQKNHMERLLNSLTLIGGQVVESSALQQVLREHIRILRENYEKDSAGRAFVLASMGLTDEKIMSILLERVKKQLAKIQQEGIQADSDLQRGLSAMLYNLSQDERLRELLRDRKDKLLEQVDLTGLIARWLEMNIKGEEPFWIPHVNAYVDKLIDCFIGSSDWQNRFDKGVKDFLRTEFSKHHVLIPGFIRERLNEFSDDELIAFVEGKVQDDLQMIRINGSVVGAMVGMGLYVLIALAERMWG